MRFFRRDHDLNQLERELRALRSEPSRLFVRDLVSQLRARPRWFEARARYVLVGVLTAAVLAASASANIFSLAATTTSQVVKVVAHMTSLSSGHRRNAPNQPNTPAQNQYATQCGIAPAAQCVVEIDPDHPNATVGGSATFDLILQTPGHPSVTSDTTFTVGWTTQDGTAHAGTDYAPQSGTVTFHPGDSVQHVTVTTLATGSGGNKTFSVVWSPSGAVMDADDPSNTVTITGGSGPTGPQPKVHADPKNQKVKEGNSGTSTVTYKITLDKPATSTVTVNYSTANGTATAGSDYVATSGAVTFIAGQKGPVNVNVTINGDTIKEPDETFFLNLSVSGPATIDPPDAQQTTTIQNDDK